MIYLIVAGVIVVCVIVMVSPMLVTPRKIKNYVGVPKDVFLSSLSKEGVPDSISSAVFEFYKSKARWREFGPAPEMDINGVFEEGPEDIDDTAIDLLKALHLEAPSELDRMAWPGGEVRTASDLARWLYWASQHQPAHSR
jgi:hypothetical protein